MKTEKKHKSYIFVCKVNGEEFTTFRGVAKYFGVNINSIKGYFDRNNEDLKYQGLYRKELVEMYYANI